MTEYRARNEVEAEYDDKPQPQRYRLARTVYERSDDDGATWSEVGTRARLSFDDVFEVARLMGATAVDIVCSPHERSHVRVTVGGMSAEQCSTLQTWLDQHASLDVKFVVR